MNEQHLSFCYKDESNSKVDIQLNVGL